MTRTDPHPAGSTVLQVAWHGLGAPVVLEYLRASPSGLDPAERARCSNPGRC